MRNIQNDLFDVKETCCESCQYNMPGRTWCSKYKRIKPVNVMIGRTKCEKYCMLNNVIMASIVGFAVGDALGVPVEFASREELSKNPVKDMRGKGTHNQKAGTWSDDTSLTIALIKALGDKEFNVDSIARRMMDWLYKGKYTANGKVFDVGNTTREAIWRMHKGVPPIEAGGKDEYSNGNGSLMRIHPLAFYLLDVDNFEEKKNMIYQVSSLTHANIISKVPADFYEMGAMDELGFYYVLKSLKNGMVEFSDLKGYMFSVPFEDGINMMLRESLQEIRELADKAEMLGIEDIRSSASVNEARRDIRARIAILNESKKVANTDMMTVLKDMGLNEEGYRVGCRLNGIVYEFVSYRPDAGDNPYVLENVSNRNPISRYRFVSFEMLSTAIRNYASSEKEDGETAEYFRLMSLAKKMVPVVENIETVVPKKADAAVLLIKTETPVTTEESGQLRFC